MIYNFYQHINENISKKYGLNVKNKSILFTDIKGSSDLWKTSEDEMFKSLIEHEKQVIKIADKFHGEILKSIGDSFMIIFENLLNSIKFSIELQKEINKNPLKIKNKKLFIRIGICFGEVFEYESKRQNKILIDYFGNIVNTASRMEAKVSDEKGFAFSYFGDIENKKEIDDLVEKECKVEIIDFKEKCSKDSKRKRSERLLSDSHKYLCEPLSNLKGVNAVTSYKCNLK